MQDITYDMFRCLSFLQRNSIKYMHQLMEEHDLHRCHPPVLYIIYKDPGLSQDDVARKMKFHKGAVAKVIKMMLDAGYIRREQDSDDKRRYQLYLTKKGEDAVPILIAGQHEYEAALTKGMTDEQKRVFIALLEKAVYNLNTAVKEKDAEKKELENKEACSISERRAERRSANREKLEAFNEKRNERRNANREKIEAFNARIADKKHADKEHAEDGGKNETNS